ncbi:unnamed protein product [Onchocerca flexuosa]|uniref:Secreted protein n=1 Tax=Onchocerca flexuosa TaxID=387005 RepID=A0A183I7Y8_9BILA|nr:unnamed protein product [Onchocerca flexuosa]
MEGSSSRRDGGIHCLLAAAFCHSLLLLVSGGSFGVCYLPVIIIICRYDRRRRCRHYQNDVVVNLNLLTDRLIGFRPVLRSSSMSVL